MDQVHGDRRPVNQQPRQLVPPLPAGEIEVIARQLVVGVPLPPVRSQPHRSCTCRWIAGWDCKLRQRGRDPWLLRCRRSGLTSSR